ATSRTTAVSTGTTAAATTTRRRVLVFAAGVAATALRTRRNSSSGGVTSDANRDGIPRSVILVLLPTRCAQGGSHLLVCTIRTLPHHRLSGAKHCGRLPDAETLLPEENVRDAVLLRHPGEHLRDDAHQLAGTDVGLRRPAVHGRKPVLLRR